MAKQRYVVRGGKVVPLKGRLEYYPDETEGSFNKKQLRNYYDLECKDGSRFKSGYSKDQIKRTWENVIEREG